MLLSEWVHFTACIGNLITYYVTRVIKVSLIQLHQNRWMYLSEWVHFTRYSHVVSSTSYIYMSKTLFLLSHARPSCQTVLPS